MLMNIPKANSNDSQLSFNWIWKADIPLKINIFLWLIHHNKLLTSYTLSMMGVMENSNCNICNHSTEDTNHIFFECLIIQNYWNTLLTKIPHIKFITGQNFYPSNWMNTWKLTHYKDYDNLLKWHEIFLFCRWSIWKTRNDNTFNTRKEKTTPNQDYTEAIEFKHTIRSTNPPSTYKKINIRWNLPTYGGFKLNTDGSFLRNTEKYWEKRNWCSYQIWLRNLDSRIL